MNDVFETFQELLRSSEPDYSLFRRQLIARQATMSGKELVCSNILMRLNLALDGFPEQRAGTSDVSSLLHQAIRAYERRLEVKRSLWQVLSSREQAFGLRATAEREPDMVELFAVPWRPSWLADVSDIDQLEQRRYGTPVIGDGLLYAMSDGKFTTYQSGAQKAAVQACLFACPGSTLLVTLPTGGGKSICMQLPAWQESRGGRIKGGTTLVIVPTVSLALDQEERAQNYFADAPSLEYKPCSLTSATPEVVRTAIRSGLLNGTLPILYTSPESLMNSSLYHICLEAARRGTINRLVIDEAHLVETWGAGFRTEFQFLSAYRRKLLEASRGQLRTLLLSATVSEKCAALLKKLFSSQDIFFSVRADRLRPEISYWFHYAGDEAAKRACVMDALYHLPRPIIMYVASPDDTKAWLELLRGQGFERIAAFSGETDTDERLRLIKEWNNNRRDVMVATSAFGVGVDKSDVRTVIHACMPENIDRFYQEVGRAGRDGLSALSLMCVAKGDLQKAQIMTRAARITAAKAIPRWEGMQRTRRFVPGRSDVVLLDTNAAPSENPEMYQGPSNREWNEHTLLLMQRAGLIDITDTRDESALPGPDSAESAADVPGTSSAWLQIQLLCPHVTSYPRSSDFLTAFDLIRRRENEEVKKSLQEMWRLALSYAITSASRCLAQFFAEIYPQSALACGGCPVCRREGRVPYARPLPLDIEGTTLASQTQVEHVALEELMGWRSRINVILDEPCDITTLKQTNSLLIGLVRVGFQQLILPTELVYDEYWANALVAELADFILMPHTIFADAWIVDAESTEDRPIYPVPTAIVYPLQDERADRFHQALRRQQVAQLQQVPIIAIVRRSLMLSSESGRYVERVNGLSHSVDSLMARLGSPEELIF
jgi:ATP-dependent DNA helicase RecQ